MSKKHFILLLPALLLLGGCETRDKVVSFWAGQAQKLMTTPYGMMMLMGAMQYGAKAHKNLDILNMPQGAEENIPWLQGMQSLPAPAMLWNHARSRMRPLQKTPNAPPQSPNRSRSSLWRFLLRGKPQSLKDWLPRKTSVPCNRALILLKTPINKHWETCSA